ncbi:MAG: DUF2586 domain-containing protein [Motiliproteus sp.]
MKGQVNVSNVNRMQGNFPEVERQFLYIGAGGEPSNDDKLLMLSGDSDLDALLGAGDSQLKTQIEAAKVNAGQNWQAYAISTAGDWKSALALALEQPNNLVPEAVVVTTPVTSSAEVDDAYTEAQNALASFARPLTVMLCVTGIDDQSEDWATYTARIKAVTNLVAAPRVSVVPLLFGNDLGAVTGRLCNRAVDIADSPMRVRTGPMVDLGTLPVDVNDAPLTMAHITDLTTSRFSVPQWYSDYNGIYWADHMMLDNAGGDFQVYENLRILDYLARRVRVLAIAKIADRSLNTTPKSIAFHNTYFMRPLRESSRGVVIGGEPFPAMIKPPEEGDIVINWVSSNEVNIYIQAAPYESGKKIGMYLMLDLNRGVEG